MPEDFAYRLRELLHLHEGVVLTTYFCPGGKVTIGVGHNLDANPIPGLGEGSRITQERALEILDDDIAAVTAALLKHLPWFAGLDPARQAVLIDMGFNLGVWGLLHFKATLGAIERGDFALASQRMLQSKWAGQVGKRAQRLSTMMLTGEWP
jgi:lysozyme